MASPSGGRARDVDEKFGILPCPFFSSLSANPRRYVANVEVPLRRGGLSTMLFTLALHVCRLTQARTVLLYLSYSTFMLQDGLLLAAASF